MTKIKTKKKKTQTNDDSTTAKLIHLFWYLRHTISHLLIHILFLTDRPPTPFLLCAAVEERGVGNSIH